MPQAIDCVQKRDAGGNVTNVNTARKRPSDYRADWDVLMLESRDDAAESKEHHRLGLRHDDPKIKANEAACDALRAKKDALAEQVWATKARDWDDALLLAEITWDRLWGVAGIARFPALPVHIDTAVTDPEAVAPLIRGIVDAARAQAGAHSDFSRGDVESAQAARGDDDDNVIAVPLPEEVPIMVGDAMAAIDAARVLWTSNNLDDRSPDRRVTEALWTCIDAAERELKRVTELIDAATERAVGAWHKSTHTTQAVIDAGLLDGRQGEAVQ